MSDKLCPQTGTPCVTLVSLKEHIESKLAAQDKALVLQERALEARLSALQREVDGLMLSRAELAGKANGTQVVIAQLIALAALVISAVGLFVR
jgi:ParB-like chromosome segregation protein Spo0J